MEKIKIEESNDSEGEDFYDSNMIKKMINSQQPDEEEKKGRSADDDVNNSNFYDKNAEEEEGDGSYDENEEEQNLIEEEDNDEEEEESSLKNKKKNTNYKSQLKKKRKREVSKRDKKPKKRHNKMDLLDIEADDDDEEEEEIDDGDAEITVQEQNKILNDYSKNNRSLHAKEKIKKFYERSAEEIAESYENMERNEEEFDNSSKDHLDQHSRQPSIKDPKLWLVKCKIGKEKEAVQSLYHKYFSKIDSNNPLKISSAVFFDSLKGSIYVEAFKEANVREAIEGIAALRENGLKIVPLTEMTSVFNYDKVEKYDIKPKQWVRLKSGVYDGDLAQVINIEDSVKVYVKVIPRLGEQKKDKDTPVDKKEDIFKKIRKNFRPPQKLFHPSLCKKDAVEKKNNKQYGECYYWNKQLFNIEGFLIKMVKAKSLILEGVDPKLEELKFFNNVTVNEENKENDCVENLMNFNLNTDNLIFKKNKFLKGDKVKVIRTSLKNMTGIVENHSNGIVQILPTNIDDFTEILEIPEEHVIKNFMPGDNIKVISGSQVGKSGLIVKVEEENAYVFSDATMTEFKVSYRDIVLSSFVTHQNEKNSMYEINDLIKINGTNQICHVLDVDKYALKVMDIQSQIKSLGIKDATKFIQNIRRVNGIDSRGNPITLSDTVKILNGPYKGKKGVIKNLFKNIVFLYNHDFPSTNGIFVEKTENVEIMGAELLKESNDYANSYGSKVNVKNIPEKFKELIGNPVKITGGNWKGYLGTLKSINDKTARVELTSKAKIVSVDRNYISKPGEISRNESTMQTPRGNSNFKTPAYYPQSPYNATSPKYNAGGSTPGNIWNRNSPKSPNTEFYG